MGLLEKASNIEAEEKPPETKVVKPKKEPVKAAPVEKKKPAKKAKKVKPPKEKKPRAPRVKKELPEGFELATKSQKFIRRLFDFAVTYGWSIPLIALSAWGAFFNPTIFVMLGLGLIVFSISGLCQIMLVIVLWVIGLVEPATLIQGANLRSRFTSLSKV